MHFQFVRELAEFIYSVLACFVTTSSPSAAPTNDAAVRQDVLQALRSSVDIRGSLACERSQEIQPWIE